MALEERELFREKWKQLLENGRMAVELQKEEVQLANQGGGDNSPVTESFRAVDQGGAGNCLFHVFRAHNQHGETVKKVRSQICAYMRKYRTKPAVLCDAQGVNVIDETILNFVDSVGAFPRNQNLFELVEVALR